MASEQETVQYQQDELKKAEEMKLREKQQEETTHKEVQFIRQQVFSQYTWIFYMLAYT